MYARRYKKTRETARYVSSFPLTSRTSQVRQWITQEKTLTAKVEKQSKNTFYTCRAWCRTSAAGKEICDWIRLQRGAEIDVSINQITAKTLSF